MALSGRQEAVRGDGDAAEREPGAPGRTPAPRACPPGNGELPRASVGQWPGSISPRVGRPKGGVEPGPALAASRDPGRGLVAQLRGGRTGSGRWGRECGNAEGNRREESVYLSPTLP